jgi:hypothetical protein
VNNSRELTFEICIELLFVEVTTYVIVLHPTGRQVFFNFPQIYASGNLCYTDSQIRGFPATPVV